MAVSTVPAPRPFSVEEYDQMVKEKNTYSPGEIISPQSLSDIRLPVAEIPGVEA
jgi:hypothetical protein